MKHKISIVAGVLIGALSATAQANVVYNWQSTNPGPYVTATGGQLVFTDAAYRAGSIDFHVNDSNSPYPGGTSPDVQYNDNFRIINSPVVSASLSFDRTGSASSAPGVFVTPGSQRFADFNLPFGSQIAFNDDGTLTGDLFLYSDTASEEVNASGARGVWSIFNYGSDYFGSERCGPPTCSGGSGYWQLASTPTDVPAPPVWSLFGLSVLGLLGFAGLRRKA